MRIASNPLIALPVGALLAAAFGCFAPRVALVGWATIATPLSAAVLGAAMLTCMLRLGRSRLLDAWNTPLSTVLPWLYIAPVLCLPLVVGAGTVYGWGSESAFAHQRAYLNVPFFVVRAALYFVAFVGIAFALPVATRASRLAAILLVAFVVANMIGIDLVMALTPQWHSSVFGLRWCVDGLLIAASCIVAWQAVHRRDMSEDALRSRIDGATLLFALDLGWIYLMFVDYVTAWSGNLPDEVIWYAPRSQGAWAIVIVAVVAVHLVTGFLLLSRMIKRSPAALLCIAMLMLVAQCGEALWTVIPGTGVRPGIASSVAMLSAVVLVCAQFASRSSRVMTHG